MASLIDSLRFSLLQCVGYHLSTCLLISKILVLFFLFAYSYPCGFMPKTNKNNYTVILMRFWEEAKVDVYIQSTTFTFI